MDDPLLARAATSKRESRYIDFKESFNPDRTGEWCEVVKDIVAMANSGGGAIVFGVKNNGAPSEFDPDIVLKLDPAKVTDKVAAYTGEHFSEFEIAEVLRTSHRIAVIRAWEPPFPLVFISAGNYDAGAGKQKTAFQNGTIYFRHGAKSEPGNASDIREFVERELGRRRKEWLGGIRKVVTAPQGHRVEILGPGVQLTTDKNATPVRLVSDPNAAQIHRLDPDSTHPHRQKEVVKELNRRLTGKAVVTAHDNLCVRRTYGINGDRPEFYYCSKFGSPQYSEAYIDWLVQEYEKDAGFFTKARAGTRR